VPGNPIGWLLLGSALAYTLATTATGLPAPHPSAPAWYTADADLAGQPLYTAGLALGFLTLLLFPTGSLPSRRWRWAGWLIGAGWLLFTIGQTFGPARLPDLPAPNPAAVGGSAGRVLGLLQLGQVLAVAGGVLACISLIVRFRRSESVVRKQIEWLAYAAGVVVAGITVNTLHPGVVETEHIHELYAKNAAVQGITAEQVEQNFIDRTPIRRILTAAEVADAVAFFAGPTAGGITGESLGIDGGLTRGIFL